MGGSVTVLTAESIREKVDQVSRLGSSPFQLVGMQFVDLPPLKADNLAIFSKLPMLSELKLLGTEITDDGLEQLKRLPALKRLTITRSHLTDDSLKYLAKMPALVYLDVSETRVTSDGVRTLMYKFSNLEIQWTVPSMDPEMVGEN
jgi:hypothetical protein